MFVESCSVYKETGSFEEIRCIGRDLGSGRERPWTVPWQWNCIHNIKKTNSSRYEPDESIGEVDHQVCFLILKLLGIEKGDLLLCP